MGGDVSGERFRGGSGRACCLPSRKICRGHGDAGVRSHEEVRADGTQRERGGDAAGWEQKIKQRVG